MLLGFSFSCTAQRWDVRGSHLGPLWTIFLPERMTAQENQAGLFSGCIAAPLLQALPQRVRGDYLGCRNTHEFCHQMSLKFYPSNFNVQTCLMKQSSCPALLTHMFCFGIKKSSNVDCLPYKFQRTLIAILCRKRVTENQVSLPQGKYLLPIHCLIYFVWN